MNAPDRLDAIVLPDGAAKITVSVDERLANAATFRVLKEDHTIGNLLRMQLLRDRRVRFAGYKIPHPLEKDIEVLVQTKDPADLPIMALSRGVEALATEFGFLEERYESSLKLFQERRDRWDYPEG